MSERGVTESVVEQAALAWLESAGWSACNGAGIAPGEPGAERADYGQVVLEQRLRDALARLNPAIPAEALEDAFRKLTRPEGAEVARNRAVHRLLVDGMAVEYRTADGEIRGAQAQVVDFDRVEANDWLAINQFSVTENKHSRRPDIVLFLNGLPLAVLELKNAASQDATIWSAFNQCQTYIAEMETLFTYNALVVISDGVQTRVGTLTCGREWFKPWRTIAGEHLADPHLPELEVVIEGIFAKPRFLDLVRDFLVFEDDGGGRVVKKMAGYHQFHAVRVAVGETLRAAELLRAADRWVEVPGRYEAGQKPGGKPGDRRVGVVWHTQGSGKSLTMAFYAGRIIREPAMENPTVVVLTDRNDLDDQLFGTFSRCKDLLRQPPVQAESARTCASCSAWQSAGWCLPPSTSSSPRRRATGTRRSPSAGTSSSSPTRRTAASTTSSTVTRATCGTLCRMPRSSASRARPLSCRTPTRGRSSATTSTSTTSSAPCRTAPRCRSTTRAGWPSSRSTRPSRPKIDPDFEEATEGEEVDRKEKLKSKWAQLEAVVGAQKRLAIVARDLVDHFETRLEAMDGKAMIVCMSRRICVELYREIVKLRPQWQSADDEQGDRS